MLRAHRIVGDPPAVDGRLEDEAWQRAASIDDFIQWEPDNMAPLSERTVAQVAYDDRHIYIAVRAFESVPGGVTVGLGRRDTFLPTDHLESGVRTGVGGSGGLGFAAKHFSLNSFYNWWSR